MKILILFFTALLFIGCGGGEDDQHAADECPDADADDVLYWSEDPGWCNAFGDHRFLCGESQQHFDDDCGCGCIVEEGDYLCELDDCPEGTYCSFDDDNVCGRMTSRGQCEPMPLSCSDETVDQCGCDGEIHTGSPDCAAAYAGVDVTDDISQCLPDHCRSPDDPAIEYTGFSDQTCPVELDDIDCPEGMHPFDDDCGCGCIHEMPCEIAGCTDGEYCYYPDDVCGQTGVQGRCEPRPSSCTTDDTYVCGCDGQFYFGSPDCAGRHSGVDQIADPTHCLPDDCPDPDDSRVEYVGFGDETCPSNPEDVDCPAGVRAFTDGCGCGCIDDGSCQIDNCPPGQYCHYDDNTCGEDGAAGECKPIPAEKDCEDDWFEVCGCDGNFYGGSSNCAAQNEGVDAHEDHTFCD